MITKETVEAMQTATQSALLSYHAILGELLYGAPISIVEIEKKQQLAQETERDFWLLQMLMISEVVDPISKQRHAARLGNRADDVDKIMTGLDHTFELAKAAIQSQPDIFFQLARELPNNAP